MKRTGVPAKVGACAAFTYSLSKLADRSWGFDGTLVRFENRSLAGLPVDRVATFDVRRWYRGGSGPQVVVRFSFPTENLDGPEARYAKVGERFLVTGGDAEHSLASDPSASSCGFTQRWTESVALQWAVVLTP